MQDVMKWTGEIAAASHKVGMLMIPNWGGLVNGRPGDPTEGKQSGEWDSAIVMGVANGTDGYVPTCMELFKESEQIITALHGLFICILIWPDLRIN